MTQPRTHSFTLFFKGADVLQGEHLDALFENGCDDALFGVRDGAQYAAFDRHADNFSAALAKGDRRRHPSGRWPEIVRIEPDDP